MCKSQSLSVPASGGARLVGGREAANPLHRAARSRWQCIKELIINWGNGLERKRSGTE